MATIAEMPKVGIASSKVEHEIAEVAANIAKVETEIADVAANIAKVETEITEVVAAVQDAGVKESSAADKSTADHWKREKKVQRKKEKQLRKKEAQLREEKVELRAKERLLLEASVKSNVGAEESEAAEASEEVSTVLDIAFEYQFLGGGADKLLDILKKVNDYTLNEWYARFVVVINSSGWGKSRTFCEVASKDIWVFYCSLSTGGYPPKSGIALYLLSEIEDRLQQRKDDENAYYGQHRVMVFMMRFYASCLAVLNDWIEATRTSETPVDPVTFVKWLRAPSKYCQGQHFWDAVQTLMRESCASSDGNSTLPRVGKTALRRVTVLLPTVSENEDIWAAWEFATDTLLLQMTGELCSELKLKTGCKVLFVFDEAKCLAKRLRSAAVPPFIPVRRSVRYLPTGMVAAFISTNSQVGNFLPPPEADESDKVSGRGSKIPPTVYGIFTTNRQPLTCTSAKDARSPTRLAQIGRPLFKAWIDARQTLNLQPDVELLLRTAADKFLGGSGKLAAWESGWQAASQKSKPVISDAAAIATAGFRLALAVNPTCQLARDVSAAHMVSVLGVSDCRRYVWTGWFVEPLLAEAAARIMQAGHWEGMLTIISAVRRAIMHQWVDVGYLGELAGRLLLLRAMDRSRDVQGKELFPSCSLDQFICNLAGQTLKQLSLDAGVKDDAKLQRLLDGVVSFNFWFVADYDQLTPEILLEAFLVNAAIVCQKLTWRIDLVVPVYLGSLDCGEDFKLGDMTAIFVQVRNVKDYDPKLSFSTREATPMHARMAEWTGQPFLSLYINVCRESKDTKMVFETGSQMKRDVLETASRRVSLGKLKALIEFHPESVAAKGSGTAEAREAFQNNTNIKFNADIYKAWAGWFKTSDRQFGLTIPALGYVGKTAENDVAARLLDQVYELAEVAGPDRKVMCAADFPQQMDFEQQSMFHAQAESVAEDTAVDFI